MSVHRQQAGINFYTDADHGHDTQRSVLPGATCFTTGAEISEDTIGNGLEKEGGVAIT